MIPLPAMFSPARPLREGVPRSRPGLARLVLHGTLLLALGCSGAPVAAQTRSESAQAPSAKAAPSRPAASKVAPSRAAPPKAAASKPSASHATATAAATGAGAAAAAAAAATPATAAAAPAAPATAAVPGAAAAPAPALVATAPATAAAAMAQAAVPPAPTPGDQLVLAARDAFRGNDAERIDGLAARLNATEPDHLLRAYPEYWALNIRVRRAVDAAMPGMGPLPVEDAVRDFLRRHEGAVVADLARRDWLLLLGKRRDLATFESELPRFVLNDDAQVTCYALLARHQRKEDVLERARAALAQPREFGDGCQALAAALAATQSLDPDEIWGWIRAAFELNAITAARRYAALLPEREAPTPATLDAIYDRAAQWLARNASEAGGRLNRQLLTLALIRQARGDPEPFADVYLRTWDRRLPPDLRATVWAHFGAAGARKLLPQAAEWSARSLPARYLPEDVHAWQVRGALRAQDWKLVRALIEKMPPEMRRARGEGTWNYWLARALRQEGRQEEATVLLRALADQHHFYGQLALEDLGQRISPPPAVARPTEAEVLVAAGLPGFARALRFYQIGARPQGNLEWNFTLRGMNDRQLLAAAEFAHRRAVLDRVVNTAERTRTEHDFAARFLTPFRDRLQPKAEAVGLELAWVYGLIRQESRFVTNIRSSAGAAGLMQIMPGTARDVARRIGFDLRSVPNGTDDPDTNLLLGTHYLRMVWADLDNSAVLATAAYNAGPGRPRAWRATLQRPVEAAIFAETIPFNETRDYVKKVMSNAVYYAALFEGKPQSLRARIGSIAPKGYTESTLP